MRATPATRAGMAFISTELGIAGSAARNIEPHAIKRRPAPAERRADFIRIRFIFWNLAAVIIFDALGRDIEGFQCLGRALRFRLGQFLRRHAQGIGSQCKLVELRGKFDQGCIAAPAHVCDDAAYGLGHIFFGFAFGGDQRGEIPRKTRGARIETPRHLRYRPDDAADGHGPPTARPDRSNPHRGIRLQAASRHRRRTATPPCRRNHRALSA